MSGSGELMKLSAAHLNTANRQRAESLKIALAGGMLLTVGVIAAAILAVL
jgi:hypothetical protein